MPDAKIQIELSRDEALVLFEWLARFDPADHPELFESQAEQRVLWDRASILEKTLHEPFAPNYRELLDAARERVRDPRG